MMKSIIVLCLLLSIGQANGTDAIVPPPVIVNDGVVYIRDVAIDSLGNERYRFNEVSSTVVITCFSESKVPYTLEINKQLVSTELLAGMCDMANKVVADQDNDIDS